MATATQSSSSRKGKNKEEARPHRSINEYLTSDRFVKIFVGPERKLWVLNEELICDRAPYFEAAFRGDFNEGNSKSMEFPEDDPLAFAKVVDYIYTERIDCKSCAKKDDTTLFDHDHELLWSKVWVLADMFNMEDLAAAAIDQFRNCLATRRLKSTEERNVDISYELISYITENTMDTSPLQTLLAEELVRMRLATDQDDCHKEKVEDITDPRKLKIDTWFKFMELLMEHQSDFITCWDGKEAGDCVYHRSRLDIRAIGAILEADIAQLRNRTGLP